jgi:SAM-dependent methyltransferase
MAEAIAWGTPVIATAYSGNLDFMEPRSSFLVPWSYTAIPTSIGPYAAGERWAEPDIEVAASMMRQVWENPQAARQRAGRARDLLRQSHSHEAIAATVVELVSAAYEAYGSQRAKRYVNVQRWYPGQRADLVGRRNPKVPLRLNLGAGDDRRPGFVSVDLRADVADIVGDVCKLPLPDEAACEIVACDILEHFPATRTEDILLEWRRVLAPGGRLTVRVPNMEVLAKTPDMLHAQLSKAGFVIMSDDKAPKQRRDRDAVACTRPSQLGLDSRGQLTRNGPRAWRTAGAPRLPIANMAGSALPSLEASHRERAQ